MPSNVISTEQAVQLILTHPVPEKRREHARIMARVLDRQVLQSRLSLSKRQEYLTLLAPFLSHE